MHSTAVPTWIADNKSTLGLLPNIYFTHWRTNENKSDATSLYLAGLQKQIHNNATKQLFDMNSFSPNLVAAKGMYCFSKLLGADDVLKNIQKYAGFELPEPPTKYDSNYIDGLIKALQELKDAKIKLQPDNKKTLPGEQAAKKRKKDELNADTRPDARARYSYIENLFKHSKNPGTTISHVGENNYDPSKPFTARIETPKPLKGGER